MKQHFWEDKSKLKQSSLFSKFAFLLRTLGVGRAVFKGFIPALQVQANPPFYIPVSSWASLPTSLATMHSNHVRLSLTSGSLSLLFSQLESPFPFLFTWLSFNHPSNSRKSSLVPPAHPPPPPPCMHHLGSVTLCSCDTRHMTQQDCPYPTLHLPRLPVCPSLPSNEHTAWPPEGISKKQGGPLLKHLSK